MRTRSVIAILLLYVALAAIIVVGGLGIRLRSVPSTALVLIGLVLGLNIIARAFLWWRRRSMGV